MEPSDAPPPGDDRAPNATPASPGLSTPVIVALLSLAGVLGGALFSNWDKVFGSHSAKPVAADSATAPLAALHGVWLSPLAQHPYQPQLRFRLKLELNTLAGQPSGSVLDIAENGVGAGSPQAILDPKSVENGLDFHLAGQWCCEEGKTRPYETFYQVRPTSQGLAVTRRNNSPGGGQVERFLMARAD